MKRLMHLGYAKNTVKNNFDQLATYYAFCAQTGLRKWSLESCAQWLLYASEVQGFKKNTIKTKYDCFKWGRAWLAGASVKDTQRGQPGYLVKRFIQRLADDREAKNPIGEAVLAQARAYTRTHKVPQGRQLTAWWILSYALLLRGSEAASLQWEHVRFEGVSRSTKVPDALKIRLASGAGEIFKTHTDSVDFRCQAKNQQVCAVTALWRWYCKAGKPTSGAVFTVSMDTSRTELQGLAAQVTGLPQSRFGLHSLRSGGATDMESKGHTLSQIMLLGRWTSAAVLLYLRGGESLATQLQASRTGARDVRQGH